MFIISIKGRNIVMLLQHQEGVSESWVRTGTAISLFNLFLITSIYSDKAEQNNQLSEPTIRNCVYNCTIQASTFLENRGYSECTVTCTADHSLNKCFRHVGDVILCILLWLEIGCIFVEVAGILFSCFLFYFINLVCIFPSYGRSCLNGWHFILGVYRFIGFGLIFFFYLQYIQYYTL